MSMDFADTTPRAGLIVFLLVFLGLVFGFAIAVWGPLGVLPLLIAAAVPVSIIVGRRRTKRGASRRLYWLGALLVASAFSVSGAISRGLDCVLAGFESLACSVSALTREFSAPEFDVPSALDSAAIAGVWGIAGFLLFSALTLVRSKKHAVERPIRPRRILISLGVCCLLVFVFWAPHSRLLYSIRPPIPLEMYRLRLDYDANSGIFTGKQVARVDSVVLSRQIDQFREWKIQKSGLLRTMERDSVESRVIHQTLLTSTLEFRLPYFSSEDVEMSVYAPDHVIIRHNVSGEIRPTILDDGTDGIALVGTGFIGYSLKLKIAAPFLQNPVLGSVAFVSGWRLALLVLTALGGLFGYFAGIALDLVKDEALKPFARKILLRLGVLREVTPSGSK